MTLSTKIMIVLVISSSFTTAGYSAGCGGGGGGGMKNYTPPTPSAQIALEILNATNATKPTSETPPIKPQEEPAAPIDTPTTMPGTATTNTPQSKALAPAIASPTPPIAGKVVWTKGTLKVVGADKKVRVLQKGSPIYPEDTIVTDGKSQAEVVFTDNTLVTFDKNTVFNVTKYNYSPESKTESVGSYIMNLVIGSYRTVTGAIAKTNPSDYKVNTEVAVMGVRGTDYSASFGACKTDMKYHSGTPMIENAKGTIVLTESSPYATVKVNAPPVSVKVEPIAFQKILPIVPATINSIKTMPPLSTSDFNGGGGGGVCGPNASGGGFNVKFK